MSKIGDNNPPPFEALSLHIEDLFTLVSDSTSGGKVENDDQESALDELLDDFRKARKKADGERAAEKKPHDDAAKVVQARWKPLLDRCDAASSEIKSLLTPYRSAKQKAKDDAAAKAREDAAAKLEEARKAIQASDDLEQRFEAEEQLKLAEKQAKVANKVDRSATGLRTVWHAEITDRKAALVFLIQKWPERFEALIQDMADTEAHGARSPIPGILYKEEKVAW